MSSDTSYETTSDQPGLQGIQSLSTTYATTLGGLRSILSSMAMTIEALQVQHTTNT